jgi:hypothetical protein
MRRHTLILLALAWPALLTGCPADDGEDLEAPAPLILATDALEVMHSCSAIVDGRVATSWISWDPWTDGSDLWFAIAGDDGSWGEPVLVRELNDGFQDSVFALAEVDGAPALAYAEGTGGAGQELRFVRATEPDGSAWGEPVAPDPTSTSVGWVDLEVLDGLPAIGWSVTSPEPAVLFAQATDAAGQGWGEVQEVDRAPGESSPMSWELDLGDVAGDPSLIWIRTVASSSPASTLHHAVAGDGWEPQEVYASDETLRDLGAGGTAGTPWAGFIEPAPGEWAGRTLIASPGEERDGWTAVPLTDDDVALDEGSASVEVYGWKASVQARKSGTDLELRVYGVRLGETRLLGEAKVQGVVSLWGIGLRQQGRSLTVSVRFQEADGSDRTEYFSIKVPADWTDTTQALEEVGNCEGSIAAGDPARALALLVGLAAVLTRLRRRSSG